MANEERDSSSDEGAAEIHAKEYPLANIFSSRFDYVIPYYQRAYAWGEDEAERLFDDIYASYKSKEQYYFLGSIVLIQPSKKPYAEVIDGQQRLTTLTILLSALASMLSALAPKLEDEKIKRKLIKFKDSICKHIQQPEDELLGHKSKPRLELREIDREFFSKYVQELNFEELDSLDDESPKLKSESQKHIKKNSQLFFQKIKKSLDNNPDNIKEFAGFLVKKCFLVVISSPNIDTAYRVFSVLNDRGLDLQPADLLKARIIGSHAKDEQDVYAKQWENMEVDLSLRGFNELFNHVRMIFVKARQKEKLSDEFIKYVLKPGGPVEPTELISKVLEPYADALVKVRNANYIASSHAEHAEKVNTYLRWLNRIGHLDWIPVAILFLSRNEDEPEYVEWFFNRLERLTAYIHICALNVHRRVRRYNDVLKEVEGEHSFDSRVQKVELNDEEKVKMCEVLDGNIYGLTDKRRRYLFRRLNSFISDGAASYDDSSITLEHVLPQTIHDTVWAKSWSEEQHKEWVHRIANLVPLHKSLNSAVQNYDFKKKRDVYFSSGKNLPSYALTMTVSETDEWTLEYLKKRQDYLLKVLRENWRLD